MTYLALADGELPELLEASQPISHHPNQARVPRQLKRPGGDRMVGDPACDHC
jgi:hypothetical protein